MAKEYRLHNRPVQDISILEPDATYSYADYLKWSFEERIELIKGKVFRMSPAPTRSHQNIAGNIYAFLWNFLKGKPCKVYVAPFDVRLPKAPNDPDNKVFSVVQPDVYVTLKNWMMPDVKVLPT